MGIISGCRSTMWNPRPTSRCCDRATGRALRLAQGTGPAQKQEQAALALTESVTLIGEGGDSGECTTAPQSIFGDAGMVHVLRPSPLSTCGTAWRCAAIRTCQT